MGGTIVQDVQYKYAWMRSLGIICARMNSAWIRCHRTNCAWIRSVGKICERNNGARNKDARSKEQLQWCRDPL
jgi:hypothetical protein